MFCNECGTKNRNDRKFCTNCGAKLTDYTKPRENLIMPEDIEKQQQDIAKKNILSKRFNITLSIILIVAIILTISTFIIDTRFRLIVGIFSFSSYIIFLIIWAIKTKKVKKLNK